MNHWSVTALILWDFAAGLIGLPTGAQNRLEQIRMLERAARQICKALHEETAFSDWFWWLLHYFEHRLKQLDPCFRELKVL